MNYEALIAHYGTEAAAGRAIGVERQTVHRWQKSGNVPLDQQVQIEMASGGALRADIPEELRASPTLSADSPEVQTAEIAPPHQASAEPQADQSQNVARQPYSPRQMEGQSPERQRAVGSADGK